MRLWSSCGLPVVFPCPCPGFVVQQYTDQDRPVSPVFVAKPATTGSHSTHIVNHQEAQAQALALAQAQDHQAHALIHDYNQDHQEQVPPHVRSQYTCIAAAPAPAATAAPAV